MLTPAARPNSADIESGYYTFWTMTSVSTELMQIALERQSGSNTVSLWGRFRHDAKDIIFRVDDISHGARADTPSRLNMEFTWRARSTQHGSILLDDLGLKGNLGFCGNHQELSPLRDVEMYLGGAMMWREGYVEARRQRSLDRDERNVVAEIKRLWDEMGRDDNRVDMAMLRDSDGLILVGNHDQLQENLRPES